MRKAVIIILLSIPVVCFAQSYDVYDNYGRKRGELRQTMPSFKVPDFSSIGRTKLEADRLDRKSFNSLSDSLFELGRIRQKKKVDRQKQKLDERYFMLEQKRNRLIKEQSEFDKDMIVLDKMTNLMKNTSDPEIKKQIWGDWIKIMKKHAPNIDLDPSKPPQY